MHGGALWLVLWPLPLCCRLPIPLTCPDPCLLCHGRLPARLPRLPAADSWQLDALAAAHPTALFTVSKPHGGRAQMALPQYADYIARQVRSRTGATGRMLLQPWPMNPGVMGAQLTSAAWGR